MIIVAALDGSSAGPAEDRADHRNEELGRKQPRVALKPRAAQNRSMLGASVYRALNSLIDLISKDIEEALKGIDVVIQTLGVSLGDLFRPVRLFSDATRILVSAMESEAVKRLICVTGFRGRRQPREYQLPSAFAIPIGFWARL